MAKARDAILDRLFLENYLAARREGDKSAKAREKRARQAVFAKLFLATFAENVYFA